ncbi:replication factor C subunit (activator I) [Legionella birminghamensis]|uniref:3'-phosphate/5'-hydroxy nucleic acid ligase n=1 Tax=Legionella birminghamensis TaxID=28083 RepID=A0A378I901_9GAMM|nr:RtcB family protein [Legionella birminghamensis]KTC74397.1 replication factor C subunit (activator I) [Legionella birminghamensis]STX31688.1 replication factor C subunit (activator I) [Legionella birminghamensis]
MTVNYNLIETSGVPIKAWTRGVAFEKEAQEQLERLARLPFIYRWISVMPDVHCGKGSTIGTVLPTLKAVIPAAVGVDIGCGMMACKTDLCATDLPDNLQLLRSEIEQSIPHGSQPGKTIGQWKSISSLISAHWLPLENRFKQLCERHPRIKNSNNINQLGTLGGGNHFIEICLDEEQNVWLMLHSGSRGVGNVIGTYFIELAKQDMQRLGVYLPDSDMAYLSEGSRYFDDYLMAVYWAQDFARANRELMMTALITSLSRVLNRPVKTNLFAVNCHHNYVQIEEHFNRKVYLTRKGTVSAKKGEYGIIPGSMGAKSFIVRGLGNPDSFHSCSHGAGRLMSRTKAKKSISLSEHRQSLVDVECRKNESTLDETPSAYKNIEKVMEAQNDLVEIIFTLKQILCVKG